MVSLWDENMQPTKQKKNLLQAEEHVEHLHDAQNDRHPGDHVPDPVQQLAVQHVRLLPTAWRT